MKATNGTRRLDMNKRLSLLILIVIFIVLPIVSAQQININGYVLLDEVKDRVPFVEVKLLDDTGFITVRIGVRIYQQYKKLIFEDIKEDDVYADMLKNLLKSHNLEFESIDISRNKKVRLSIFRRTKQKND